MCVCGKMKAQHTYTSKHTVKCAKRSVHTFCINFYVNYHLRAYTHTHKHIYTVKYIRVISVHLHIHMHICVYSLLQTFTLAIFKAAVRHTNDPFSFPSLLLLFSFFWLFHPKCVLRLKFNFSDEFEWVQC